MPYANNSQLPPSVQRMPPHTQDVFREAFNHAYEEYGGDDTRAFRVAWAAVKRQYEKRREEWLAR